MCTRNQKCCDLNEQLNESTESGQPDNSSMELISLFVSWCCRDVGNRHTSSDFFFERRRAS